MIVTPKQDATVGVNTKPTDARHLKPALHPN